MKTFQSRTQSRSNRGFTLIELLVVIAIIAILAAILFPVFARARENARRASCQSNLKQIGLGIFQYSQDYDERYPQSVQDTSPYLGWGNMIQPYIKSWQLFQCPSEPTAGVTPLDGYFPGGNQTDYFYNGLLGDPPGAYRAGVSIAKIDSPALGIMAGDQNPTLPADSSGGVTGQQAFALSAAYNNLTSQAGYYCYGILGATPIANGDTSRYGCQDLVTIDRKGAAIRHLDTANYLFADGHVKSQKPTQLYGANTPYSVSGSAPTFRVYDF